MIKVFTTREDFTNYKFGLAHDSIGIIPTMGNLHLGHLSLLKQSLADNTVSVITIFVNPKQFGPNEDFDKYPRTLDEDLAKISNLALHSDLSSNDKKEIIVFAPRNNDEIYPTGFNTIISVKQLTQKLEGKFRPDHFDGVTTVVYRLFKIIGAKNAYFGQKDFQQCIVIKKMIFDLELDIKLNILPIVRNTEGLALSSRNQFLTTEERMAALHLSKTLKQIEMLIKNKEDYKPIIANELNNNKWDYLEVLNAENLEEPNQQTSKLVVIGAFKLGVIRLLDNILVQTV
ncbi:MAG: pantoate--beta-alanine ligase [Bacteriovorax sp.]|nr:pantoate--beta-alanine ligase [Bacteriovorax sp.]